MTRAWIGLALLSASWLFGLGYYHGPNWPVWVVLVVSGTGLLLGTRVRTPARAESLAAAAMLIPALLLAPWPYRAAAILLTAGLVLVSAPIPRRWPARLGAAALIAGSILAVQALAILLYETVTARSHELPWHLPQVLLCIARWLGVDAALDGSSLALHSMRRVHLLGTTWELLAAPVTWAFLVGGVAVLRLRTTEVDAPRRPALRFIASLFALTVSVALWLPVRAALLIAVFTHRALRTEYDASLVLMNQFWSPWVHLLLLVGPVLLVIQFIRLPSAAPMGSTPATGPSRARRTVSTVMAFVGSLLLALGLLWDPTGPEKTGRVWVDEHRSTWERTDRPYDPNWYGQESGYNYACIYDYCSRFYTMERLHTPIDANTLADCDVFIVKVPTARYGPEEIAHIEHFVENGGGLLLVGEHTNVFNTGTYLNDIASRFGFRFRYDCLFDIDTVFEQLYQKPLVPHPIVQHVPPLNLAVSCSIAPGRSVGRAAIRARGLRSLPADYHASNYYPQVTDRAESRYGAFIELWTTQHGAGRVAAFGDSTIFSNFSTFEPGKAELMLGMLQWLNHRNPAWDPRPVLVIAAVAILGIALVIGRRWSGRWFVLLSGAALGISVAGATATGLHRAAMPVAEPNEPLTRVVIDRTVCDAPLSRSGFIAGQPDGFGIFERWILRLGYFTHRTQGRDAFTGDLLIFMYPNAEVPPAYRQALVDYVTGGGNVLVLDSPANLESTADALLHPFDLSIQRQSQLAGRLDPPDGWPDGITVETAFEVSGGEPLVRLDGRPVAATTRLGEGTVTVIGFGARFTDPRMGVIGDAVPDASLRRVYELEFRLLRSILSDAP